MTQHTTHNAQHTTDLSEIKQSIVNVQPIPTTKTRVIDGELYRRLSETVFYATKEAADKEIKKIEANKYRGRSYKARYFEMGHTKYTVGNETPEIRIQYFIYVKVVKRV